MKRAPKLTLDSKNFFRLSNGYTLTAPVDVPFRGMFAEVFESGCYQPSASYRIRPGETVLDIGANIGLFSLWVAWHVPSAKVFAFEAAGDNFAALAENIRRNRLRGISAHRYAVSNGRRRQVTLYRGFHGGIHSIRPEYRNWDLLSGKPRPVEQVRTIMLEQIFRRFKIGCVDFLKLDCEGAEYEILLSAPARTLARVRRIVGEYHNLDAERQGRVLKKFLSKNGFQTTFKSAGPGKPWGMFVARQP